MAQTIDTYTWLVYNVYMKYFDWNAQKNERLKRDRDVSFEEVVIAIESGGVLDVLEHPNKRKYLGQKVYIVNIHDYAYLVPFVENKDRYFLKTIFPSRKMTQKYIIRKRA